MRVAPPSGERRKALQKAVRPRQDKVAGVAALQGEADAGPGGSRGLQASGLLEVPNLVGRWTCVIGISRLRVRFYRVRFRALARSREVIKMVYFSLAVLALLPSFPADGAARPGQMLPQPMALRYFIVANLRLLWFSSC